MTNLPEKSKSDDQEEVALGKEQSHGSAQPSTQPLKKQQASTRYAFDDNDADGEDDNLVGRHRGKLLAAAIIIVGGSTAWLMGQSKGPSSHKAPERMVMISPVAPPPPPPPPPPPKTIPPPPQEKKMVEQEKVPEDEKPPEPKPADEPPALGTNIKGGDGSGPLSSGPGTGGGTGGNGANGGSRSRWGWYAGRVQSRLKEALSRHPKVRTAKISGLRFRIWPDSTGRITRAELEGSTGDSAMDGAIRDEVLKGMQLSDPPPQGMPMPIVLRLTAQR